jgi:hypothetical protein
MRSSAARLSSLVRKELFDPGASMVIVGAITDRWDRD